MMNFFSRRMNIVGTKAQSVLEYAVLVTLVSFALLMMGVYVRRAVQGGLYDIEGKIIGKPVGMPTGISVAPPI